MIGTGSRRLASACSGIQHRTGRIPSSLRRTSRRLLPGVAASTLLPGGCAEHLAASQVRRICDGCDIPPRRLAGTLYAFALTSAFTSDDSLPRHARRAECPSSSGTRLAPAQNTLAGASLISTRSRAEHSRGSRYLVRALSIALPSHFYRLPRRTLSHEPPIFILSRCLRLWALSPRSPLLLRLPLAVVAQLLLSTSVVLL